MSSRKQRVTAVTATVLVAVGLGGCGSGRSVAAYCASFFRQADQLSSQWAAGNSDPDPLVGIVQLFGMPQQIEVFFANLDKVAPQSIEADVAAVKQSFQQEDSDLGSEASNPLGGLVGGLVNAITSAPAFNAVDAWTSQNCGPMPGTKWLNGGAG